MSAWTKAYWPSSGERGSTSRVSSSRRTRARRRGSSGHRVDARHRGQRREREALAQHRGIGHERPVVGRQPVEPRRDERRERLGDRERGQVADRPVDAILEREPPSARSMRTVSTAYSGIPSARSTIARMAPSGSPGTRPARSARIAGSDSGSRYREVKLRLPAPQSGRRSSSSGPRQRDDVDGERCGSTRAGGRRSRGDRYRRSGGPRTP